MDLNWLNPLFPIILKESRNNYFALQNHKTGDFSPDIFIFYLFSIIVKSF